MAQIASNWIFNSNTRNEFIVRRMQWRSIRIDFQIIADVTNTIEFSLVSIKLVAGAINTKSWICTLRGTALVVSGLHRIIGIWIEAKKKQRKRKQIESSIYFFSVLMDIECAVRWEKYVIFTQFMTIFLLFIFTVCLCIIFRCLCACVRMYARLCERVLVDDFTLFTSFVAVRVFATDTQKMKKNCVYEETCIVHLICAPGYAVEQWTARHSDTQYLPITQFTRVFDPSTYIWRNRLAINSQRHNNLNRQ